MEYTEVKIYFLDGDEVRDGDAGFCLADFAGHLPAIGDTIFSPPE